MSHTTIQSNSNTIVSIKWSPKKVGCWRDVLQFTDSRRIKYDVAIITTAKNSTTKCNKQQPLIPLSSKQLTNRDRKVYEEKKVFKNKTTYQESFSSFDKQIQKDVSRLQSIQDEENIANMCMNYKHTTESIKKKCDNVIPKKNSDEFLKFIDSSAFNLTVVNTDHKLSNNKKELVNQMQSIPSIISEDIEIRRETYVKGTVHSKNISTTDREDIYEDSLSPQVLNNGSEFSVLMNNLALEPTNILETSSNQHRTSTKDTFICNNYTDNYAETMSVQTDGNGTYNLSPMLSINSISNQNQNSMSNRTLDLSIRTQNVELWRPKQLPENIHCLSPINTSKNDWANTPCTGVLPSSSPISSTSNFNTKQYSTTYKDPMTVKDVLEADLWVKGNNNHRTKMHIRRNIDFGTTVQEKLISTSENIILNKTQTFDTEKSSGICIEISPPKRYFHSKTLSRKISPKKYGQHGKEKSMHKGIIKKKVYSSTPAKSK